MIRARALVAAVPQPVWAAVVGLALLGSIGVALVVGAGLSTWRGAVSAPAHPPAVVVRPPSSGVVVVPSHAGASPTPRVAPAVPRRTVAAPAAPAIPAPVAVVAAPISPAPVPAATSTAAPVTTTANPQFAILPTDLAAVLAALEQRSADVAPHGRALGHFMRPAAPLAHALFAGPAAGPAAAVGHARGHDASSRGHGVSSPKVAQHGHGKAHGPGFAHGRGNHGHAHGR